jgi:hypothetical protein
MTKLYSHRWQGGCKCGSCLASPASDVEEAREALEAI